jgi:hypothetical protein
MDHPVLVGRDNIEKLIKIANELDQKGMYEEADEIDAILRELLLDDEDEYDEEEDDDDNIDAIVRSNGLDGNSVTDNQNSGMFQGFSDSYFYRGYGNLEGAYGPQ